MKSWRNTVTQRDATHATPSTIRSTTEDDFRGALRSVRLKGAFINGRENLHTYLLLSVLVLTDYIFYYVQQDREQNCADTIGTL